MKTSHRWLWLWAALPGLMAWAADPENPPPKVYQAPPPQILVQTVAPASPPNSAAAPVPAPSGRAAAPPVPVRLGMAELEKLVAPMALYPDPLVAAILPASAYPIEIVLAARFVKDPKNLSKLDQQGWDENVKTVARIPEVIQKMNDDLPWTIALGEAFVVQQRDVMNAIQTMRAKAQASGALKSTPEQTVTTGDQAVPQSDGPQVLYVTNQVIQILPAQQEVIYVPRYDPAVVYVGGPAYYYDWWWPCITFGLGVWYGSAGWGHCDWYGGWVGCPPHYAGHPLPPTGGGPHPPGGGGHPPPGGGHPPPDGGKPPPGGGHPPSGNGKPPGGGGNPPVAAAHPASTKPWQPDANRLRAAGTRGSQAAVQARDPAGWQTATANPASRPAYSHQSMAGSRPAQYSSPSSVKPTTVSGAAGAGASSPWSTKPVSTSIRSGGFQTAVAQVPASSAAGASPSKPTSSANLSRPYSPAHISSTKPGFSTPSVPSASFSRPNASAGFSQSKPSFSAPSPSAAYSRPFLGSSPGPGVSSSFSKPAAAPSFGGNRGFSSSPSPGAGGFKAPSGGGGFGGRGGGAGFGGGRGGHR